jgi:hypothetical protein
MASSNEVQKAESTVGTTTTVTPIAQNIESAEKGVAVTESNVTTETVSEGIDNVTKSAEQGKISVEGFNAALAAEGATAQTATLATKAATVTMKALAIAGNIAITAGIMMAISGISKAYKTIKNYSSDTIKVGENTTKKYANQISKAEKNIASLNKQKSTFETLASGTEDKTGENIGLTTSQYEEYLEIRNKVLKQNPSLIEGYDSEGNALASNNTLMEKAIQLQEEKLKNAQKESVNSENWEKQAKSTWESQKSAAEGENTATTTFAKTKKSKSDIDEINKTAQEIFNISGNFLNEQGAVNLQEGGNAEEVLSNMDKVIQNLKNKGIVAQSVIDDLETLGNDYSTAHQKAQQEVQSFLEDTASIIPKTLDGYEDLSTTGQNFLDNWIKNQNTDNIDLSNSESIKQFKEETRAFSQAIIDDDSVVKAYEEYNKVFADTSKKSAIEWE